MPSPTNSDADVDDQRVAVPDGRLHRLAPAGHHLQVMVLAERHAQFAQVAGADANVLEHLGVVVGIWPPPMAACTS